MYERLDREGPLYTALPFPLNELPPEGQPLNSLMAGSILHALLTQSAGLAGVLYGASLYEETAEQDMTQGLHMLSEWLNTTLAVWRRWEEERAAPHAPVQEEMSDSS